ncbi:hypothetical protein ACKWTF_001833 [Chironomus riparius]
MGLCTYFINGNCRFGSKCVNDHIDLKTLLKNEADAVINGKQWLLSCFGPFKESVVVPNFIPDQSFEEVRIAFMENSKNGNVQNYVNNLMTEYNDALRKINEIRTPSSDTLQLIASIYNTSNSNEQKVTKPAQSQAPNPFQSSNMFGGATTQPQTMPSSSIFGASATQSNPFQQATPQQPSNSMFGSSTTSNPQPSAFSFNQATVQDQQKSSMFGQSVFASAQNQSAGSAFSSNQSNIFAQQASAFAMPSAQTGTSVFGSSAVQQPPQSVFGSTAIQQPTQSVFAATNLQQGTQSVFEGNTNVQQPAQSIFGAATPMQPAALSVFESTPIQQGTQSVFGASAVPQTTQNIFGGSTITPQQPTPSVFGAATQQPVQNVFGGSIIQNQQVPNVFGGTPSLQPSQNVFSTVQNPQNVFGGFNQNQVQSQTFSQAPSVFGSTQQPQQQSDSMSSNIFNTQAPQTGQSFAGNPFQQNVTFNDDHFYSKDEDLSPDSIQAFQAESFIPGRIPIMPPSKTLAYC